MAIQFAFNTVDLSPQEAGAVVSLLQTLYPGIAQPAVAQNSGSARAGISAVSPVADAGGAEAEDTKKSEASATAVKKTRKPKDPIETESRGNISENPEDRVNPEDGEEAAPTPAKKAGKEVDLEAVTQALQGYVSKHGLPAAMELLRTFKATRTSEVAADQREAFINATTCAPKVPE